MSRNELLEQLKEIFLGIFDNEGIEIEESTTPEDVEEWDSITHIQLVVALEKHFNTRFTSKEIQNWNSVKEIMDCISPKIKD